MKTYAPGLYPIQLLTTPSTGYCIVTVIGMTREGHRGAAEPPVSKARCNPPFGFWPRSTYRPAAFLRTGTRHPTRWRTGSWRRRSARGWCIKKFSPLNLRMNQRTSHEYCLPHWGTCWTTCEPDPFCLQIIEYAVSSAAIGLASSSVMAVVILKTSEYTKANRCGVENTSRETKIIEWIWVSDKSVKRVYIIKVSSPCLMILKMLRRHLDIYIQRRVLADYIIIPYN